MEKSEKDNPGNLPENTGKELETVPEIGDEDLSFNDVVTGLAHFFGGIPTYLHKNVANALHQLYTITIAYPAARVKNAIAEENTASQERQKLTKLAGKQIAAKMQTDEKYAQIAGEKFAQKILRERANLNRISEIAIEDLVANAKDEPSPHETETPQLSQDWLNVFENEGAPLSSEEMQRLFGKILSGEIRKPGSYSIRTVRLMAQLDNTAAKLFVQLCSLATSLRIPNTGHIFDARVISMGNAGMNTLAPFGLGFEQLNVLHEYGLIIPDYNSYRDYAVSIAHDGKVSLPLTYQNKSYALIPKSSIPASPTFQVHGVALSQSGKELLRIVDVVPEQRYTDELTAFFDKQGFALIKMMS